MPGCSVPGPTVCPSAALWANCSHHQLSTKLLSAEDSERPGAPRWRVDCEILASCFQGRTWRCDYTPVRPRLDLRPSLLGLSLSVGLPPPPCPPPQCSLSKSPTCKSHSGSAPRKSTPRSNCNDSFFNQARVPKSKSRHVYYGTAILSRNEEQPGTTQGDVKHGAKKEHLAY